MRYSRCKGIDKDWSQITFGCWQMAPSDGWGDVCTPQEADAVVKAALDVGITAFDTAEGYGEGESERRLGKALGNKTDDVIIVSKIWPDAELSLKAYKERLDGSLKALGRDYMDLYLVHWPGDHFNSKEKSAKLADILSSFKESGKVKTIGLSNFHKVDLELLDEHIGNFSMNEVPFSLLEREYEGQAREICAANDIFYMAYSPTAKGLLARPLNPADLKYPARQSDGFFRKDQYPYAFEVFQQVKSIADELNCLPVHVALAWVNAQDNVLTSVLGSWKADQITQAAPAGDLRLSEEHIKCLTQASDDYHFAISHRGL